jgi:hypothetical protein
MAAVPQHQSEGKLHGKGDNMSVELPAVRRVVTGHDGEGKAISVFDGLPPNIRDGFSQKGLVFYELWNTRSSPVEVKRADDPTVGKDPVVHPPEGGTILRIIDIPPEAKDATLSASKAGEVLSSVGLAAARSAHSKNRHPLMHRTETIDYGIVLFGEVVLILDDAEVTVKAGDVIVQCGTIHAWANRSDKVCRMAFVLIDGKYEKDLSAQLKSA